MFHIQIFPPEDSTGLGPVTLPPSFRALKAANDAYLSSRLPLMELRKFLDDREGRRALGQLEGSAAAEAANFFDTLLRTKLQDRPEEYRRTLRALRSLSESWGVLPASYKLQGVVEVSEMIARIGTGYSEVWRGTLGSENVAVKAIKMTFNTPLEDLKKQLSREAIIWKHLEHPNILKLYGVSNCIKLAGIDSRHICLVSPWMENGIIRKFATSNPTFNRFELLVGACEGLIYLHSKGLVHGDLKGDNVLVDDESRAILADFGFARTCNVSESSGGGGTPAYMAPELFKRPAGDGRSPSPKRPADIFALGTLIYEVLSGQRPFYDWKPDVIRHAAAEGLKLDRPSWTSIPTHAVWDMVERCRAKEAEDRPALTKILECLTHASKDPPAEWPSLLPLSTLISSSSGGSAPWPQSSSQATPLSLPPVLWRSQIASDLAQPPQKSVTVQLLVHNDGPMLRWRVMGDGIKKQEPGLKKRNTE